MPINKIVALVLVVVGVVLLYMGYQMSESLSGQFTRTVSGSVSNDVLIRYVAGGVLFAVGGFMLLKK